MRRRQLLALCAFALLSGPARADEPWFYADGGVALSGYDAVAYITRNEAVRGSPDHAVMWKGATWHFVSAENRSQFEMNPSAYAPQYGGYCAYAVSRGYTAKTDPEAFTVHDGKLYMNYSRQVQVLWDKDRPGHITSADANWPAVLSK